MFTKKDLVSNLSEIGIDPHGTLKVHISYKAIGDVVGYADTVLDAFMEYMRHGLLVFPSHTWGSVRTANPVMDVLYTPTCVGALTELFRKRDGVVRSLHPTHSVAAFGADAAEFVSGEEKLTTPCGKGGAYYKLWERDAQILLVGVDFTRNTFIHGIEEWDGAEGTIKAESEDYYVIDQIGRRLHTPQFRHCSRLGSSTFSKLEPFAHSDGILSFGRFGNATTRLVGARDLRCFTADLLKNNPLYLAGY